MRKFIGILFLALAIGCQRTERDEQKDVVAVYFHEHGEYSVLYRNGKELINQPFIINRDVVHEEVRIFEDVPSGSNMWYEAHWVEIKGVSRGYSKVRIHVRRPSDINSAGWNHGKFGSGMTSLVQVEDN